MLDKTNTARNGALLFPSPEAMFEAMFGPEQHDFHVREFKLNKRVTEYNAACRLAWEVSQAEIKAAGSVTAWLRGSTTKIGSSK